MSYRSSHRPHHGGASYATKKSHSEKNQQILKSLAKHTANKNCADCKTATNPRWASWNIGIFICIRCSGIHRSMGTHISKVKSIDLDSWTDEQVQSMVDWGNAKSNSYWEHNLPKNHIPDDSKIQNFIRTKYELKKWVATKYLPDPKSISVSSDEATAANILTQTAAPHPPAKETTSTQSIDLLADLGSSATPSVASSAQPVSQKPKPQSTNSASSSLLDLNFGPSPSVNTTGGSGTSSTSQPAINSGRSNRPDLKKSILALYSNPSTYNKPAAAPVNNMGFSQQQPQATLNNSFSGLSLSSTNSGSINTTFGDAKTNSSNVWNSSPNLGNSYSTSKNNPLDDDLFKNVWS